MNPLVGVPPQTFPTAVWIPGQCWFHRYADASLPRCPHPGIYGSPTGHARWSRAVRWCAAHKGVGDVLVMPVSE